MIDVLFVILPDSLLLDLAGPAEAFRLANQVIARQSHHYLHQQLQTGEPLFRLRFVGPQTDAVSSVGILLSNIEPLPTRFDPAARSTWVVLLGRPGLAKFVLKRTAPLMAVRNWLSKTVAPALDASLLQPSSYSCRLITVCVGALLAADAGLLKGKRCTTHHELLDELAACSRDSHVIANRVFVEDGPIATSAGVTAGIDLALHLIASECGEAIASSVAQVMVAFARRTEADQERSPLLAWRSHMHPAVHRVQEAVSADPRTGWTLLKMAKVACVTPRHLNRLFVEHAGLTPRDYVEKVRLTIADHALHAGIQPVKAADISGFGTPRRLAHARGRQASNLQ